MEKARGHIIKRNDVKLEGRVRIDTAPGKPNPLETKNASANSAVRIVENNPDFAVIELTCGCGTTTHLRCQYSRPDAADQAGQTQNNESEEPQNKQAT